MALGGRNPGISVDDCVGLEDGEPILSILAVSYKGICKSIIGKLGLVGDADNGDVIELIE